MGRIVEASESDSSLSSPDSSIGFSGSESGSASRSRAMEACATGDPPCMMPVLSYDRLRVCQSLPGLKGLGFWWGGERRLDMLSVDEPLRHDSGKRGGRAVECNQYTNELLAYQMRLSGIRTCTYSLSPILY